MSSFFRSFSVFVQCLFFKRHDRSIVHDTRELNFRKSSLFMDKKFRKIEKKKTNKLRRHFVSLLFYN